MYGADEIMRYHIRRLPFILSLNTQFIKISVIQRIERYVKEFKIFYKNSPNKKIDFDRHRASLLPPRSH